jgi:hypothetical protein
LRGKTACHPSLTTAPDKPAAAVKTPLGLGVKVQQLMQEGSTLAEQLLKANKRNAALQEELQKKDVQNKQSEQLV